MKNSFQSGTRGHGRFLKACKLIVLLGLLNFVFFLTGAIYLGGDAVNGKVDAGRYYVFGVRTESGHKIYTQVSKNAFTYSRWHVYTLFMTWPLVMVAAFVLRRDKQRHAPTSNEGRY